MKSAKLFSASLLTVSLGLFLAQPAQALVIKQTQEMSTSSYVKVEGGTDVKAEAESNNWGKQSQKVVTHGSQFKSRGAVSTPRWNTPRWSVPSTDGQARIEWEMRGGSCHIRYSEVTSRGYKYSTSASCDDGGLTIGGLAQGKTYRFQVRKDGEVWSRPVTVTAL